MKMLGHVVYMTLEGRETDLRSLRNYIRNLFKIVTIKHGRGPKFGIKSSQAKRLERTIMENDCIGESLIQQIF